ncbi:MAG TPA: cell division protein FtsB [Gammaproteobacteria bacterium]|nr:cell division protein FtsB [Gammaproteobacteria bacterium]HBF08108.1 cell division protein FtsB [Gammaproteobacteria bacterium]HCK92261.1 cell division protein FtsB [Gammaproteobacteria bacterium]|tara:strand:- start:8870 stop:9235 length:366 start_codon:yes stop_codon:yes gene_type:complete
MYRIYTFIFRFYSVYFKDIEVLASFQVTSVFTPGKLLILLQLVVLAWLGTLLIMNGVVKGQQLHEEILSQADDNKELHRRNQRLVSQVDALRSDDVLVVEERARKDLGMVKDDETFFIFVN